MGPVLCEIVACSDQPSEALSESGRHTGESVWFSLLPNTAGFPCNLNPSFAGGQEGTAIVSVFEREELIYLLLFSLMSCTYTPPLNATKVTKLIRWLYF